ncbi:MAG: hypothetical protein BGP12_17560 [Rhodospirillales bacterium 70-18]|nr:DUF2842 domain-containing protein [Rhodospirillales bacterium]OJY65662.1 MAG: hypothetical protein BGP12_17560 [Rhodospirillales bacterium 70-18]
MSRIPIAVLAGVVGFVAYIVGVVTLADLVVGRHWAVQAAYFVLAGVLWALPARWLMLWAARR